MINSFSLSADPLLVMLVLMNPRDLTASQLAAAYRSGELKPTAVLTAYLDVLEPGDVYRILTPERALQQAKRAEDLFERGAELGPLQGVPVALKDLIDTRGDVTAAGSKVLAQNAPAEEDAPVAARLDAAGAVFLGKTNTVEFAFSGLGLNPHFGTAPNALDSARVPGGSSAGSAVAVASNLAPVAVGSDTGGSVRIPAAFNGLVGLKTTNGLVPKDGVTPLSTSLDTLGPLTRTLEDGWHLFNAMTGRGYSSFVPQPPQPLKLLVPTTIVHDHADPEVLTAFETSCERFAQNGHTLERQTVPEFADIMTLYAKYGSFASHESLALYEDLLASSPDEFDPRVVHRILEFRGRPSTDYLRLSYARDALVKAFWQRYRTYDAILCPTVAILPPTFEAVSRDEDYFRLNGLCLRNTMLFNFLGGPAVSVPGDDVQVNGKTLSVGLMVATAPGTDGLALAVGSSLSPDPSH